MSQESTSSAGTHGWKVAIPAVVLGVVVVALGLPAFVGTASATAGEPVVDRSNDGRAEVVGLAAAVSGGAAHVALTGADPDHGPMSHRDANLFQPMSQPAVLILAGSGALALLILWLLRLKNGFLERIGLAGPGAASREPWEPVTDADRVEKLLLENGGYMKQSRIVEQTEWSKAKVSRLLTRMAEEGRIRKDKDGRENVIVLEK
jgi:uncharacterized membrane protein